MKTTNQFITPAFRPTQWEETPDGFLRVKARVLAERIMPYGREELVNLPAEVTADIIPMVVRCDCMSTAEALRTLEGAQVVAPDHVWVTPDNAGVSKGNTAGAACIDGPYLCIDLFITDPTTIDDIKSGRIGEISAGYHADTIFEHGEFDGQPYLAKQTCLRFNHIAIIPYGTGRAGEDVRIINKKKEGGIPMSTRNIRLKNSGRIVNVDEETAKALEEDQAAQDTKEESMGEETGRKFEVVVKEAEEAKSAATEANEKLEEVQGELSVYKEKVEELLSDEYQEGMITEAIKEQGEAEEIIENVMADEKDEKLIEKVKNDIKGLRGIKLKTAVLNAAGIKTEGMSPDAIKGAFTAQATFCNKMMNRTVAGVKMLNKGKGEQIVNQNPKGLTSLERLGFPKK